MKTDTEFSANCILVSKFLTHIHQFWEFVFLGTVKTVTQLSHLLERVTKLTWETLKLSRLFQHNLDLEDKVCGKISCNLFEFQHICLSFFIRCNMSK